MFVCLVCLCVVGVVYVSESGLCVWVMCMAHISVFGPAHRSRCNNLQLLKSPVQRALEHHCWLEPRRQGWGGHPFLKPKEIHSREGVGRLGSLKDMCRVWGLIGDGEADSSLEEGQSQGGQ